MLSGSGRFRVADDVFDVVAQDIVYCPRPTPCAPGRPAPTGWSMLAFGAHTEGEDAEMDREFWTD